MCTFATIIEITTTKPTENEEFNSVYLPLVSDGCNNQRQCV